MQEAYPMKGELVPVEKFQVSRSNVRVGEPFGDSEEDHLLIANLRQGNIIGPFKVRPENGGYGVVIGRRRFLAKKVVGAKHLVAGVDFVVEAMDDEEALEASLVENLDALRKTMNPIIRANALNKIVSHSVGLRDTSRRLGIPASTLSEWLKVLELSPKLQEAMAKGLLPFKDGIKVARLNLGEVRQDSLAEILTTVGLDAFRKEVARFTKGKGKRGIPKGVYEITRVSWDTRNRSEMTAYETLTRAAKKKKIALPEYLKNVLISHAETIKQDKQDGVYSIGYN